MKLHQANTRNGHTLTGYGAGYVSVNGTRYEYPLIVTPDALPRPWAVTAVTDLSAESTGLLLAELPDIVIIGTGQTQIFPRPAQMRPLIEAGIGLEIMNTPAACRTFNILVGEGRNVLAALILA